MSWLTRAEQERVVMALLEDGWAPEGRELREESGGLLSRGTMYVTLDRMEDAGMIVSWAGLGGSRFYMNAKLYHEWNGDMLCTPRV